MSQISPVFIGKVSGGKLTLNNPSGFDGYLLSLGEREVQLVVGRIRKPRSNQENRYYWGVVITLLSEATGYTEDEMHDALRMLFLRDNEKSIPTLKSTAALSTLEFEEYLSKIRVWASQEIDCYIPEPNEVEQRG